LAASAGFSTKTACSRWPWPAAPRVSTNRSSPRSSTCPVRRATTPRFWGMARWRKWTRFSPASPGFRRWTRLKPPRDRAFSTAKTCYPDRMQDSFGRSITYLRVSVTDRCDFRCVYCMSEHMSFLPKAEMLSLEELERLCLTFVDKGVERLRITGGEPLVRKNVMRLFERLGARLGHGLKEVTLT